MTRPARRTPDQRVRPRDRAVAHRPGQQRPEGDDRDEHDARGGLHEGERAPADRVLDGAAQQGGAGDPRQAGEGTEQEHGDRGQHDVRGQPDDDERQAGGADGGREEPSPAHVPERARALPDAERSTEEHRGEQHRVPGGARAQAGGVDHREADDHAAGGEGPDHAAHDAAHHRRPRDVGPALDDLAAHRGADRAAAVGHGGVRGRAAGRLGQPDAGHHGGGHEERHAVGVQGEVDLAGHRGGEPAGQVVEDPREQREAGEEERGQGRGAVRGDDAELVGRLELPRGHEVGDHGVLGRGPEQRGDLDEDRGHEQPRERPDQRDREEQQPAHDVEHDEAGAPVHPVGEHPGERAEEQGGGQAEHEDTGHGEAGGGHVARAAGQLGREEGDREQPQPVAEAGQAEHEPQPPERLVPQHRAGAVVRAVVDDGGAGLSSLGLRAHVARVRAARTQQRSRCRRWGDRRQRLVEGLAPGGGQRRTGKRWTSGSAFHRRPSPRTSAAPSTSRRTSRPA